MKRLTRPNGIKLVCLRHFAMLWFELIASVKKAIAGALLGFQLGQVTR